MCVSDCVSDRWPKSKKAQAGKETNLLVNRKPEPRTGCIRSLVGFLFGSEPYGKGRLRQ